MNDVNRINKIGRPYLVEEKTTGRWKVGFEYALNGRRKRYYFNDGLNDAMFFDKDKGGNIRRDKDGNAKLLNVTLRRGRAQKRIDSLNEDLDTKIFNIAKNEFTLGDNDKSIAELFQEYIDHKLYYEDVKKQSVKQYQTKINTFINYTKDVLQIDNITLLQCDYNLFKEFFRWLTATRKRTLVYRDNCLVVYKMFYTYLAKEKGIIITNPLTNFSKKNKDTTEKHSVIEASTLNKVVEELNTYNQYLGTMYLAIFFTLHRIDTLTKLQYKDFDLDNELITIPSKKTKNNNAVTISIAQPLLQLLKEYTATHNVQPDDYLFGGTKYMEVALFSPTPTSPKYFSNAFFNYKKKVLNNIIPSCFLTINSTLYSAKHSGVKFLLDSGLSLNQIVTISGHRSIDQLGTYAKEYQPIKVKYPQLPEQQ